jgi:hypothetical protein
VFQIPLPQAGGQYQSFLSVAEHFGIGAKVCTFVGADEESSDRAFVSGEADAVFRVRASEAVNDIETLRAR